jgi:hypothetical protein
LYTSSSKTIITYDDSIENSHENTEVLNDANSSSVEINFEKSCENDQNKHGDENKEDIRRSDSSVIQMTFKRACPQIVNEGGSPLKRYKKETKKHKRKNA